MKPILFETSHLLQCPGFSTCSLGQCSGFSICQVSLPHVLGIWGCCLRGCWISRTWDTSGIRVDGEGTCTMRVHVLYLIIWFPCRPWKTISHNHTGTHFMLYLRWCPCFGQTRHLIIYQVYPVYPSFLVYDDAIRTTEYRRRPIDAINRRHRPNQTANQCVVNLGYYVASDAASTVHRCHKVNLHLENLDVNWLMLGQILAKSPTAVGCASCIMMCHTNRFFMVKTSGEVWPRSPFSIQGFLSKSHQLFQLLDGA